MMKTTINLEPISFSGSDQMKLHDYQEKVARCLRSGQSVIIQAPTGSGKTIAALWPYLERWEKNDPQLFPRKCIYSTPMRILAKTFLRDTDQLIQEKLILTENPKTSIQTGERPEDRQFEGDLIFATIDQSLSSLLGVPYALSSRQANLNAGAMIGAYLVFDEYHLFPTTKSAGVGALGATLQMLKLLKSITPFCLMTATFSKAMLNQLADILNATVVTVSEEELIRIETDNGKKTRKTRHFQVNQKPLPESAQEIINSPVQRIIAVCNRVELAQQLYQELRDALGQDRVILLHARFLKKHRQHWEREIEREFGKNANERTPGKVVLVATQVVEVGLDISCDELHTEVAPANAVIQRAGRCARRPGESGVVIIHPLPEATENDKKPFLPYSQELCAATLNAFSQVQYNNQLIRFEQEQQIINLVHNEDDQELLTSLKNREKETLEAIEEAMMFGETGERRGLIRSVNNVNLLVHTQPEQLGNPFACEGFSLYTGTLKGKWDLLCEWANNLDIGWPLQYPIADEEAKQRNKKQHQRPDENNGQAEPEYMWRDLTHPSLIDSYPVLAIHPCLVIYDERLGFHLAQSDGAFTTGPAPVQRGSHRDPYTYDLESYPQHVENMLRIYRRDFQGQLACVNHRLEKRLTLNAGAIDRAARLVIALHDVGKLDTHWQQWAQNYQAAIRYPTSQMIAHTHSQTEEHRKIEKRINPRRPHHAGEGAAASMLILQEFVKQHATDKTGGQGLYRAMLTAITRHHHSQSGDCQDYRLHPAASTAIQAALQKANLNDLTVTLKPFNPNALEGNLLSIENRNHLNWFLYFVLVRPLILCDHKSLAEK
jgi:CRISPR-associated endonuclease/helicase Cas3